MPEPEPTPSDLGFLTQEQLADMHLHAPAIMRRVRNAGLDGDTDAAAAIMDSVCRDYALTYLAWRRGDGGYDALPPWVWDHAEDVHLSGPSATVFVSCYEPGSARAAQAHCQMFQDHPDARWIVDPKLPTGRAMSDRMRPVG